MANTGVHMVPRASREHRRLEGLRLDRAIKQVLLVFKVVVEGYNVNNTELLTW